MEHFVCSWCWFEAMLCQYPTFQHTRLVLESEFFLLLFPMPGMSGIWYCFVGGLNFSTLIFTSRGTRIADETLQNFINEHTGDLKNIQRIQKKRKRENLQDVGL
jgi:hypothetical protein